MDRLVTGCGSGSGCTWRRARRFGRGNLIGPLIGRSPVRRAIDLVSGRRCWCRASLWDGGWCGRRLWWFGASRLALPPLGRSRVVLVKWWWLHRIGGGGWSLLPHGLAAVTGRAAVLLLESLHHGADQWRRGRRVLLYVVPDQRVDGVIRVEFRDIGREPFGHVLRAWRDGWLRRGLRPWAGKPPRLYEWQRVNRRHEIPPRARIAGHLICAGFRPAIDQRVERRDRGFQYLNRRVDDLPAERPHLVDQVLAVRRHDRWRVAPAFASGYAATRRTGSGAAGVAPTGRP